MKATNKKVTKLSISLFVCFGMHHHTEYVHSAFEIMHVCIQPDVVGVHITLGVYINTHNVRVFRALVCAIKMLHWV